MGRLRLNKTTRIVLFAASLIGCGSEKSDHLATGSRAFLNGPMGSPLDLMVFECPAKGREPACHKVSLAPGTHVIVLDNEGGSTRTERRVVEVQVADGEHGHDVGYIARNKLRPSEEQ